MLPPVEAEPADTVLDGLDVFHIFPGGVGIVEPQVAAAGIIAGQTEIETDGLGMTDMEVTVRLRRETGYDGLVLAGAQILVDDVADKIRGRRGIAADRFVALVAVMCCCGHRFPLCR